MKIKMTSLHYLYAAKILTFDRENHVISCYNHCDMVLLTVLSTSLMY